MALESELEGGAAAGLVAGCLMMLAFMAWSASLGQGFWMPLQLIGGSFLGLRALLGGFGAGLLGLVLHLATAAFWGATFASLLGPETTPRQALWAGLVYGVSVWALMTWIGLPVFDRTMEARIGLMPGAWFTCHLIYGAALCATPPLRRRFAQAASRARELRALEEREGVIL